MMYDYEKIKELRNALQCLLGDYENEVTDACHCNDYGREEQCSYCYAKDVLKKTN